MPTGYDIIYTRYDIRATLASGQTFAFTEADGGFSGIAGGRPVEISERGDGGYEIKSRPGESGFWRRYFDLGGVYDGLLMNFIDGGAGNDADEVKATCLDDIYGADVRCNTGRGFLTRCVNEFRGLRILRQPVWETVCSFIISANNHQKRIESIYRNTSAQFGCAVEWGGRRYYAFPSAQSLASLDEFAFRALGYGYRAPYILETARTIAAEGLPDLDAMGYDEAMSYLLKLRGVGEKVADCILLFSSGHQNAFPVDVWIERALREHYGMEGTRRKLKLSAQAMFGGAAGIVQQYLFHGMRTTN